MKTIYSYIPQKREIDESKFLLYKYSSSENTKKNLSFSKGYTFEKCYLVQKEHYKTFIKYYNNLVSTNIHSQTVSFGSNNKNSFHIILKMKDLANLSDFYIVKREFLSLTGKNKALYEKQNIYFFKDEQKVYLLFPDEPSSKNVLEILEIENKDKNDDNKMNIDFNINEKMNKFSKSNLNNNDKKEKIIKKFLLLIAFQKDFQKLMERPIEDEYNDIKDYYLINTNWINQYINIYQNLFNAIKKFLNDISQNLGVNYLYNYFYQNFDDYKDTLLKMLLNTFQINNQNNNLFKAENMYPTLNSLKESKYPIEFLLFPENLFDLFFDDIIKEKFDKNGFRYTTLIGNNVLFVQDKSNNKTFYSYIINDENQNLQPYCIFKFYKKETFFKNVNKYIKNKDFISYLLAKKINLNSEYINANQDLKENELLEGECIILDNCPKTFLNIIQIKNEIKLIFQLFMSYKKFIDIIGNLTNNNKHITNINDVVKYNWKSIPIILITQKDMIALKQRIFFEKLEYFINNKSDNNKIEEFLFNTLKNSFQEDFKTFFSKINQINLMNIDSILNKNNGKIIFSFINLELIQIIYNYQNDYTNIVNLNNSWFSLFKNKNKYYVFNEKLKKLYNVIQINNTEFKLEEFDFFGDNKNLIKILKNLIKIEKNISDQFKSSLKFFSHPQNFYLVNKDWMDNFKKYYSYDTIKNNYIYDDEILNKKIKPNQAFPEQLKQQNNLISQVTAIQNTNISCPYNFAIIKKEIFEDILLEINQKFNIFLKVDNYYKISFADRKIFISDNMNKSILLIYSNINSNYELDYIIKLQNGENLSNLLFSCDYTETLEEFFISNFALNLKETRPQIMFDDNLNKKGDFLNIKPKHNIKIKQAKHALGLENIGATCYMNATIQCLCHVFSLKNYFSNRQIIYQDTYNKNCSLTKEFYCLINNLWKESYQGKSYYTPRSFKNKISDMNPLFKGIAANDSKDLIIFLYETMHAELNNPDYQKNYGQNIINDNELKNFRNNYYSQNFSIFSKTFYFEQQSELRCLNCQFSKLSYAIYNIIIFPLEKVREFMSRRNPQGFASVKLENCFEHYQEEEILFGSNQIYCNNCRQMSNAANGNKLFTLPEVMTIILNRGKGLEFDVEFEYPLKLNVDRFVLDKQCKDNNYELICVLSHIGPSGMAGHFIAFCKSPNNNRWYIYNDAQVSECDDPRYVNDDMIEGLPYVLFYQKCKVKDKVQENIFNQGHNMDNMNMYNDDNEIIIDDPNQFTLYFKYNDKELYLDTDRDKRIYDIINDLHKKYRTPKEVSLYLEADSNLILLEYYKSIKDYPKIINGSKLVVINNY